MLHAMALKIVRWWAIVGAMVGVGACTAVPAPAPAPPTQVLVEEGVSVTVVRPSATLTPSHTPTITASPSATYTSTPLPTQTATLPAPTNTSTPFPTNIPEPDISNVIVSSQGQLALIQNEILYVETAPMSGNFIEIGRYAHTATWSPDGVKLVYSLANAPDTRGDEESVIYTQYLWSADDKSVTSLAELIPNYPNPPYNVDQAYWSPDSTRILLYALYDSYSEQDTLSPSFMLSVIDLSQKTFLDNQLVTPKHQVVWLTNDVYVLRFHCGSPCAEYAAYNYAGQQIWSPYWATGGAVAFAPKGNFMINVGRIDTNLTDNFPKEPYLPTVDEIDLSTGTVTIVWQLPRRDNYFTAFIPPRISPDEQFISFNFGGGLEFPGTLHVIDRNGNEYGKYTDSTILDWRSNGDLVINEFLESGESRLVHLRVDGSQQTIFTTSANTTTGNPIPLDNGGVWSPDGRYFVFIVENRSAKTSKIYLWQPNSEPTLIYSTSRGTYLRYLTWLPNSEGVYFGSPVSWNNYETVWFYNATESKLTQVVPSQ